MQSGIKQNSSPSGHYLIAGLASLLLVLFFFGIYAFLYYSGSSGPTSYHEFPPRQPVFFYFFLGLGGVIFLGGPLFLLGVSLYLLHLGAVHYAWDDETLSRRSLFNRTTLRWSDITELQCKSIWGNPALNLKVMGKTQMRIHPWMTGEHQELIDTILHRLSVLVDQEAGIMVGDLSLHSDGMSLFAAGAVQFLAYDEIRYVYQDAHYQLFMKQWDRLVFADENGDRAFITSQQGHYHQAFFYLKAHLASAVWVDLTARQPPTQPRAAYRYHSRRLINAQAGLRELKVLLTVFTLILAAFVNYDHVQGKSWHKAIIGSLMLFLMELSLLFQYAQRLWQRRVSARAVRSLEATAGMEILDPAPTQGIR